MNIRVDKDSDVPLHDQIALQLVFLIGTGALRSGAGLPSVRALARSLKVHRNTVSRAFHDLVLNKLVEKHAGRRLVVRSVGPEAIPAAQGLDELIQVVVTEALRRGYSLQQLHDRLRSRLMAAPPDHVLVLSDDPGMRRLLPMEIKERVDCRVDVCTPDELLATPDRGLGALVVSPPGHIPKVRHVLSPERPAIPITYSPVDEHIAIIRRVAVPSVIAIVSVSSYFLEVTRGVLAPVAGGRHEWQPHLFTGRSRAQWSAADFVFCDAISYPAVREKFKPDRVVLYRVMSDACLGAIASGMSHQHERGSGEP